MDLLEHLHDPRLQKVLPVEDSKWTGRAVYGPHRLPGRVEMELATPFGVSVALVSQNRAPYQGLRLEVTELLSAPGAPAARRAEYLRNYREMHALHDRIDSSPTAAKAWHRRVKRFEHYDFARWYAGQALLGQVQQGDELVYSNGPRVVVLDPEAKICRFTGRRTHIRVQALPEYEATLRGWGWKDATHDVFVDSGARFPLPTLGLI
ncbi:MULTISPECIES: hypothetical protein [Streptomyces]|uniref:hypothetical protein n=1 Tax=Streptomyces TaxID=1883 RepID=UPI002F916BAC